MYPTVEVHQVRLQVAFIVLPRYSRPGPFPPSTPPVSQKHLCSPTSQVLRTRLTSCRRASRLCRHGRFPDDPSARRSHLQADECRQDLIRYRSPLAGPPSGCSTLRCAGVPGSRAWNFDTCSVSATPPCPSAPCHVGALGVAFSVPEQDRHTVLLISELDGWPASPLTDATPAMSPSPAYGSRPELLAGSSL